MNSLQDSASVNTAFIIAITEHCSIAHQASDFDVFADFVERRDCMTCSKRDKVLALTVEDRVSSNKKRIDPLLGKCREDLIEVVFGGRIQDTELEPKSARGGLRVLRLRRGNRTCWIDE